MKLIVTDTRNFLHDSGKSAARDSDFSSIIGNTVLKTIKIMVDITWTRPGGISRSKVKETIYNLKIS